MQIFFSSRFFRITVMLLLAASSFPAPALAQKVVWEKVNVLLYTRNGEGYVHDNIPNSIEAIETLSEEYGFSLDATDDPAVFEGDKLKNYQVVIFSNTNNEVFERDQQRVNFMRFIQAGGGFVGIHSAAGTEREWKWFKELLGGTFFWHEPYQSFSVKMIDPAHPSLAHLPQNWEREDECYYLKEMRVNLKVLAVNDLSSIEEIHENRPNTFGEIFPSVWCQEFDGGRQWYTSLGHNKEDYKDHDFRKHLLGGMQWVVSNQKQLDYTKAYARSPDDGPEIKGRE